MEWWENGILFGHYSNIPSFQSYFSTLTVLFNDDPEHKTLPSAAPYMSGTVAKSGKTVYWTLVQCGQEPGVWRARGSPHFHRFTPHCFPVVPSRSGSGRGWESLAPTSCATTTAM